MSTYPMTNPLDDCIFTHRFTHQNQPNVGKSRWIYHTWIVSCRSDLPPTQDPIQQMKVYVKIATKKCIQILVVTVTGRGPLKLQIYIYVYNSTTLTSNTCDRPTTCFPSGRAVVRPGRGNQGQVKPIAPFWSDFSEGCFVFFSKWKMIKNSEWRLGMREFSGNVQR